MIEPRSRILCPVCPCPPHIGECGRDVVVPEEMTSTAGGYVARCYCVHSSPQNVVAIAIGSLYSPPSTPGQRRSRRGRRGGLR